MIWKRFGDDLEKIWRYKTEQPKIGKEIWGANLLKEEKVLTSCD